MLKKRSAYSKRPRTVTFYLVKPFKTVHIARNANGSVDFRNKSAIEFKSVSRISVSEQIYAVNAFFLYIGEPLLSFRPQYLQERTDAP